MKTVAFYRKQLPHWEVEDGTYFLTLRLRGSLPAQAVTRLRLLTQQMKQHEGKRQLAIKRRIFREMEHWLDRPGEVSYLTHPEIAPIIMEAIQFRERNGTWRMKEYVIMSSHIHLLFSLGIKGIHIPDGWAGGLEWVMEPFKGWTGWTASRILGLQGNRFWQREWFDHYCRSIDEELDFADYIRQNPVKAGLVGRAEDWPYGSWGRKLISIK